MNRPATFLVLAALFAWGSLCDAIPGVSVWRSGLAIAVPIVVTVWLVARARRRALWRRYGTPQGLR